MQVVDLLLTLQLLTQIICCILLVGLVLIAGLILYAVVRFDDSLGVQIPVNAARSEEAKTGVRDFRENNQGEGGNMEKFLKILWLLIALLVTIAVTLAIVVALCKVNWSVELSGTSLSITGNDFVYSIIFAAITLIGMLVVRKRTAFSRSLIGFTVLTFPLLVVVALCFICVSRVIAYIFSQPLFVAMLFIVFLLLMVAAAVMVCLCFKGICDKSVPEEDVRSCAMDAMTIASFAGIFLAITTALFGSVP